MFHAEKDTHEEEDMERQKRQGAEYEFYGKLPLKKAIPLGLQHVLAMFVGNLTPILIISGACGIAGEEFGSLQVDLLQNAMLIEKMKQDPTVVAITSGTPTILGFTQEKRKQAGRQFVDVGIAEETAVALASGIAKGGGKPVYGVYSSFIQRTYDQISQDLCIDGNPATIVVYTGSVFGMTDVTHLGLQDIPMLSNIPGLVYLAPATKEEYLSMLDWSVEQKEMPVAIKLPGGDMISDGRSKKPWMK